MPHAPDYYRKQWIDRYGERGVPWRAKAVGAGLVVPPVIAIGIFIWMTASAIAPVICLPQPSSFEERFHFFHYPRWKGERGDVAFV